MDAEPMGFEDHRYGGGRQMVLLYIHRILIPAAVIPAIFLLVKIYRADRRGKEPPQLLTSLVFCGILATAIAMVAERVGFWLLGCVLPENSLAYQLIEYFVIVALAEEGAKYYLLKRRTWTTPAFNFTFDGVVYAAFVSLGFALWENISYVTTYGLDVAVIRAVTAIPGHACFGVFMGAFYGAAKKYEGMCDLRRYKKNRRLALIVPAFLHGLYDFTASMENRTGGWIFLMYIIALFLTAFVMVRRLSQNDEEIPGSVYFG